MFRSLSQYYPFYSVLLHYPLVTFVDLYQSTIEDASTASPEDISLLLFVAERISNQEDTLSRLPYIAKLKTVTALCSTVCMSIRKAKELSAAASPNLPAFSLPDHSPSGLGQFHRFSECLNTVPDTDHQALSESGQTMPEMRATLGKVDTSTDFQLQYLANAPSVINQSSSDTYECTCRTGPFYPFQKGNPAPRTMHDLPQASLPQDWPPIITNLVSSTTSIFARKRSTVLLRAHSFSCCSSLVSIILPLAKVCDLVLHTIISISSVVQWSPAYC